MGEKDQISEAAGILQSGGIVIFPTDTVWGIGASLNNPQAIKRLYQIKKREKTKPTAVLVGSFFQAEQLGEITQKAKELIKKHWPGGLTIIIKAKQSVPRVVQGKTGAVGLRIPDHKLLLKLLDKLGTGIAAGSANFAGRPAPASRGMIDQRLIERIDLVLEGECGGRLPSTVIDARDKVFKIIRQGSVKIL